VAADSQASRRGRYRAADAVHTRTFDGELVILDLAHGEYFALDPIGSRLWVALEQGRTIEQVAAEVVQEYDVSPETAAADLEALLEDLVRRGLLVAEGAADG
jgi:hypothetical protein